MVAVTEDKKAVKVQEKTSGPCRKERCRARRKEGEMKSNKASL